MGYCSIKVKSTDERTYTLQEAGEVIWAAGKRKIIMALKRFVGAILVVTGIGMIVSSPKEDAAGMLLAIGIGITVMIKPELLGWRS